VAARGGSCGSEDEAAAAVSGETAMGALGEKRTRGRGRDGLFFSLVNRYRRYVISGMVGKYSTTP